MTKFVRLLLPLLSLACSVFAQEPRTEQPRTRTFFGPPPYTGDVYVAFWNIEWFPAGPAARDKVSPENIQNHIRAVADILDVENPTILVASEIRNLEAAKELNKALKQPYPYLAVTDYQADNSSGKESNANRQEHALFSRIPWNEVWEVDFVGSLPVADDRPARGYIGATFTINGETVTIYGVHPKSNYIRRGEQQPEKTALKNVEKRERASRYLLEDMQRRGLDPLKDKILVVGDFNTDIYAERFQGEKSLKMILHAGFFNSLDSLEPAARVTIPKKKGEQWPDTVFDYIVTSVGIGEIPATVVQRGASKDATVGPGVPNFASDHYLVKVHLTNVEARNPVAKTTPKQVDPTQLPKSRRDWPNEVMLTKPVTFPVLISGKEHGTVELPAGTKVKLVDLQDEQVRISFNEATVSIPASETDLADRLQSPRQPRRLQEIVR